MSKNAEILQRSIAFDPPNALTALVTVEVSIVGATVFDSERAASVLPEKWREQLVTSDILDLDDIHRAASDGI